MDAHRHLVDAKTRHRVALGNRWYRHLCLTESDTYRMSRYARITGTGSCLPPRQLSNADMVELLAQRQIETSDEWIVERTGIRSRHFVDDGVFASDLGVQAARQALKAAGVDAADIDLIIVATSTPDMVFPGISTLQNIPSTSGRFPWPGCC